VFESHVTAFTVTMSRSELLGPQVRAWLTSLPVPLPTPAHEIAVAMMRDGGFVTNAALREWGVERHVAGSVLRDLTDGGVAIRQGGRRYARYVLDPALTAQDDDSTDVAALLAVLGVAAAAELQDRTGLSRASVVNQLNQLIAAGVVEPQGAPRSPLRRYRWIGTDRPTDRRSSRLERH
jgi:ATP-dependent DNA helicase RecG